MQPILDCLLLISDVDFKISRNHSIITCIVQMWTEAGPKFDKIVCEFLF